MSTNGVKLSINDATKNSLKRHVHVYQPWPGPLGADPRKVEFSISLSILQLMPGFGNFPCWVGHPLALCSLPLALRQVIGSCRSRMACWTVSHFVYLSGLVEGSAAEGR